MSGEVVTVREALLTVREETQGAGAVTTRAEVVVVRAVATPATLVTVVEPVNVAIVQSGGLFLGGTYTHEQLVAAATWTIPHPLGKRPSVSVQDSAGNLVLGEVQYLGDSLVVVRFTAAFSGRADLN